MIRINVFIQVSEANRAALIEAGKELVERYAVQVDPTLHAEVLARYEA